MLSKEEFTDFLHPEEAPHMKDIVVQVSFDDSQLLFLIFFWMTKTLLIPFVRKPWMILTRTRMALSIWRNTLVSDELLLSFCVFVVRPVS